ncbi:unnamed protein product [Paramecium primaurelia]|uniref:Uncharacterized protein n=1 Tax=Paramecium primaurelia TaxID=5886 RepID=A0A8S1KS45_PARPR|nr:unnamed protein product [Paramecium primaurelia]
MQIVQECNIVLASQMGCVQFTLSIGKSKMIGLQTFGDQTMAFDHALLEFTNQGLRLEDQKTSSGYKLILNEDLDEIKQIWCLILNCTFMQKKSHKNSRIYSYHSQQLMNQSLLHLIQIAQKHENKFEQKYLDDMITSCKQNGQNDRYLILLLIKIWNNQEFLGYRFKLWVQQHKVCNSKSPVDLLRYGQVSECIQKYEKNLSRNTFEAIKKTQFFSKYTILTIGRQSQTSEREFKII